MMNFSLLTGVTLEAVLQDCKMDRLQHVKDNHEKKEHDLVQPFSLCVFYNLLNAVDEMHSKKWAHQDLHSMFISMKIIGIYRELIIFTYKTHLFCL
jgi:hypothetical protein